MTVLSQTARRMLWSMVYIHSLYHPPARHDISAFLAVSTQTCLTIPLSHNLAELGMGLQAVTKCPHLSLSLSLSLSAGPGCVCCEPDGGIRDLANSSLRRKLFGQPSRESEEEEEEEGEGGKEEQRCTVENVTPMRWVWFCYKTPQSCHVTIRCRSRDCSHLSSTPLKSHSSPLSPPVYSAHSSGVRTHNPTSSSLVLTPGVGLPQLSPIEGDQGNSGRSKGNCDTCKRLFQLTPNLQVCEEERERRSQIVSFSSPAVIG